ncbi:terminase [Xenorhabdus ehlersii]|uniref:Terminase n=1 Tax=Xenorhabdus ehlersii TaxID=290111 RepID=A0A2D0IKB6_9GAMM|nr:terminase [Xenorhabdus ehlersii]PHM22225.1 hypothetical protein Xehl_03829 [Xenorhabdus ehlersii]RKE90569.1 hypothetical protein BDE27_2447 [Xenorhabdus ehlersii]
MARPDWGELKNKFLSDHAETGVSPKEWCESQGLNYSTARRYIKNPTAHKTAQNETRKVRNSKKRNSNTAPPFEIGNSAAVKHSGYSKYLPDSEELFKDAAELDLAHELLFVRARTLSVTNILGKLRSDFESTEDSELRGDIAKQIMGAEQALDRNIARVESIERTLASLDIDRATLPKVIADTEFRLAATRKTKLEADKLQKEIDTEKEQPIKRMEVIIVGENNQGDTDTTSR